MNVSPIFTVQNAWDLVSSPGSCLCMNIPANKIATCFMTRSSDLYFLPHSVFHDCLFFSAPPPFYFSELFVPTVIRMLVGFLQLFLKTWSICGRKLHFPFLFLFPPPFSSGSQNASFLYTVPFNNICLMLLRYKWLSVNTCKETTAKGSCS